MDDIANKGASKLDIDSVLDDEEDAGDAPTFVGAQKSQVS
jgi:hypothetical protein